MKVLLKIMQVCLKKITNIINEMVDKAKGRNLLGVGVGLPGFIDREKGVIRAIQEKTGWENHLLQI